MSSLFNWVVFALFQAIIVSLCFYLTTANTAASKFVWPVFAVVYLFFLINNPITFFRRLFATHLALYGPSLVFISILGDQISGDGETAHLVMQIVTEVAKLGQNFGALCLTAIAAILEMILRHDALIHRLIKGKGLRLVPSAIGEWITDEINDNLGNRKQRQVIKLSATNDAKIEIRLDLQSIELAFLFRRIKADELTCDSSSPVLATVYVDGIVPIKAGQTLLLDLDLTFEDSIAEWFIRKVVWMPLLLDVFLPDSGGVKHKVSAKTRRG